jgi:hypothetical protein
MDWTFFRHRKKITAEVLVRYFTGNCPTGENLQVEHWLNTGPANPDQALVWVSQAMPANNPLMEILLREADEVWTGLDTGVTNTTQPAKRRKTLAGEQIPACE